MNIEREDYRKLMSAILRQAMDDYIKMQHPNRRRKKYEKEAFWSAVGLLWDPAYAMDIADHDGDSMGLLELAKAAADRENLNVEALHEYLLQESNRYWDEKNLRTVEIPEDVVVEGHVYEVRHHAEAVEIDYEAKTISLNKTGPVAEEQFMQAMVDLACHHSDIRTSQKARQQMGKSFYRLLRINNCFVGDQ